MQLLIIICVTLMLTPLAMAQKQHAFIWNTGTGMTDLGTLGGDSRLASMIAARSAVTPISPITGLTTPSPGRRPVGWSISGPRTDIRSERGRLIRPATWLVIAELYYLSTDRLGAVLFC